MGFWNYGPEPRPLDASDVDQGDTEIVAFPISKATAALAWASVRDVPERPGVRDGLQAESSFGSADNEAIS